MSMKYPANLQTCLQEIHMRDIRFELAKEILLSMPDLMNEDPTKLAAQAIAITTALTADVERLGWLTQLPQASQVPHEVTEQIERAIAAQAHANQLQRDAAPAVSVVPRGFGQGH